MILNLFRFCKVIRVASLNFMLVMSDLKPFVMLSRNVRIQNPIKQLRWSVLRDI